MLTMNDDRAMVRMESKTECPGDQYPLRSRFMLRIGHVLCRDVNFHSRVSAQRAAPRALQRAGARTLLTPGPITLADRLAWTMLKEKTYCSCAHCGACHATS